MSMLTISRIPLVGIPEHEEDESFTDNPILTLISDLHNDADVWKHRRRAARWTAFSIGILIMNSIVQALYPSLLAPISHIGLGIVLGSSFYTGRFADIGRKSLWRSYSATMLRAAIAAASPDHPGDFRAALKLSGSASFIRKYGPSQAHLAKVAAVITQTSPAMRRLLASHIELAIHSMRPNKVERIAARFRARG